MRRSEREHGRKQIYYLAFHSRYLFPALIDCRHQLFAFKLGYLGLYFLNIAYTLTHSPTSVTAVILPSIAYDYGQNSAILNVDGYKDGMFAKIIGKIL